MKKFKIVEQCRENTNIFPENSRYLQLIDETKLKFAHVLFIVSIKRKFL